MKLSECFKEENFVPELKAARKEEAIREMVQQLCATQHLTKEQGATVERAVIRREELGTTGIGKGMAVPHAKIPGLTGINGVFGRSRQGVEFSSLDGQPVKLVFMLVSSPEPVDAHLKMLKKVMALMKDGEFCAFLQRAQGRTELAELLREADERVKA